MLAACILGCSADPRLRLASDAHEQAGVVLQEVHTQTGQLKPDTLITYVTARAVRVSHAAGDAILDFDADRIVLLDAASRTYRTESLTTWEARIRAALDALRDSTHASAPRFERAGATTAVAGYASDRYVLFATRQLLDTRESVEQQVWVTTELEMPPGAFEAYQRALGSLDNIGMPTAAPYPAGVVLRREIRTRPLHASRRLDPHVETSAVFRVESKRLSIDVFTIPPEYRNESAAP